MIIIIIYNTNKIHILYNDFDIDNIKVKDIINYNPVSVESDRDINYMLKTIQNHEFLISFIPIIDNRKIRGSITFFNLINSES